MLRAIEKLVVADKDMKIGNHAVIHAEFDHKLFTYFGNTICVVDTGKRTFYTDYCGWSGSSSTTRAINSYKDFYGKRCQYKEVEKPC